MGTILMINYMKKHNDREEMKLTQINPEPRGNNATEMPQALGGLFYKERLIKQSVKGHLLRK